MGYIPQQALANLKKYAYKSVDKYVNKSFFVQSEEFKYSCARSPVSNYVLGPFWTWFVTLWPKTVAPNTVRTSFELRACRCSLDDCQITLSGLMIVLVNFATMMYYDPHYLNDKEDAPGPPQWVYFT